MDPIMFCLGTVFAIAVVYEFILRDAEDEEQVYEYLQMP